MWFQKAQVPLPGGDGDRKWPAGYRWNVRDLGHPSPVGDQLENGSNVRATAFTADGSHLLCAPVDWTVRIWDVHDPAPPVPGAVLRVSTHSVRDIALSADGTTLAAGDDGGAVTLWNVVDPDRPVRAGDPLPGSTGWGSVALSRTRACWSSVTTMRPRRYGTSQRARRGRSAPR